MKVFRGFSEFTGPDASNCVCVGREVLHNYSLPLSFLDMVANDLDGVGGGIIPSSAPQNHTFRQDEDEARRES